MNKGHSHYRRLPLSAYGDDYKRSVLDEPMQLGRPRSVFMSIDNRLGIKVVCYDSALNRWRIVYSCRCSNRKDFECQRDFCLSLMKRYHNYL